MREDEPAARGFRARLLRERFHHVRVRKPVEAVACDALCLVAPRQRQQRCNARHVAVERGVEARHVRDMRQVLAETLDQRDLRRQVLGRPGGDLAQRREDRFGDDCRLAIARTAVDDAMPGGADGRAADPRIKAVQHGARRAGVVDAVDRA